METYTGSAIDEALLLRTVAPRPMAWVTTRDAVTGAINMAPFSAVTIVANKPPTVLLVVQPQPDGGRKLTAQNIVCTGELVINLPHPAKLPDLMRSASPNVSRSDRATVAGVEMAAGQCVQVDRLIDASCTLECRLSRHEIIEGGTELLFALVICIHAEASSSPTSPFSGALGYEHFVSQLGVLTISQPYLNADERVHE